MALWRVVRPVPDEEPARPPAMYLDLIVNLSLLIAVSAVSGFLGRRVPPAGAGGAALQGLLFGAGAVLAMLRPMVVGPGLIFDGRSIELGLCAWFFGPWATLPAVAAAGLCRLALGGEGTLMGVLVVFTSSALGLGAHFTRGRTRDVPTTGALYGFGLVVHLVMVALMFTLPRDATWLALRTVALPVLALHPLATVLAGSILANQRATAALLAALEGARKNLDVTLRSISDAVIATDLAGRVVRMNPTAEQLTGWREDEALGRPAAGLFRFVAEETQAALPDPVAAVLRTQQAVERGASARLLTRGGEARAVSDHAAPIRDEAGAVSGVVLVCRDQTARRRQETALRESLREKEALLKEVHHRVKNNLQVIMSLLRLEAARSAHPPTRSALGDMRQRIHSMALLHETLYRSGNLARVDFEAYVRQVATHLIRSQNPRPGAIRLHLELQPTRLAIDQAIPCGLIINELVANSLKHAFPGNVAGEIRVGVAWAATTGTLRLTVADTGAGLPADWEARRAHSLGLQLVQDLTRQLQGGLDIGPGPGTCFTITFTPKAEPGDGPDPAPAAAPSTPIP